MTEENMHVREVPNWMLYDLIVDFKRDVDRRFMEVDNKFEEFRKEVKQDFAAMEAKIDKNTELINELYRRGDKIELSFSRKVLLGNGVFAGLVAFFTALITGRMVIET